MQNLKLKKLDKSFDFDSNEKLNKFFECSQDSQQKTMQVLLDGEKPKYISSDGHYFHTEEQLEEHLQSNPNVKGLIVNVETVTIQ